MRPCAYAPSSPVLFAPMPVQPSEDLADAAGRHRDARVRGTVIEVQRVAVTTDGGAAGKGHVGDVSMLLVGRLRSEDPFVAPQKQALGMFEIEQGHSEPVETAGRDVADAVIEH